MNCIFCLEEKGSSAEHVFPHAIGGHIIINNVCSDCNSKLGHNVDSHLSNSFLIKSSKAVFGIKDKNGQLPQIFGTNPLKDNPNVKIFSEIVESGKPLKHKVLTGIKEFSENGITKYEFHSDQSDKDELFTMINKKLKRNNIPQLNREQFEISLTHYNIDLIEVELKFNIDYKKIAKAIVKIGYELANIIWGPILLNEKHYNSIREWLLDSDNYDSSTVGNDWLLIDKYKGQMKFIYDDKENHIALFNISNQKELYCIIRIFENFYVKIRLTDKFELLTHKSVNLIVNETMKNNFIVTNLYSAICENHLFNYDHE